MPIAYSFDRRKTGPARNASNGKLCWDMVREIRTFAGQQGFGLSTAAQIRELQKSYPVSMPTLRDVLNNHSYYDPSYVPGQCDAGYWGQQSVARLLLVTLQRSL